MTQTCGVGADVWDASGLYVTCVRTPMRDVRKCEVPCWQSTPTHPIFPPHLPPSKLTSELGCLSAVKAAPHAPYAYALWLGPSPHALCAFFWPRRGPRSRLEPGCQMRGCSSSPAFGHRSCQDLNGAQLLSSSTSSKECQPKLQPTALQSNKPRSS